MARTKILDRHWKTIIRRIRAGRCVPFLGAAANRSVEGAYEGLPLGADVALRLVERETETAADDLRALVERYSSISLPEEYRDLGRTALQDLARVAFHVECASDYDVLVEGLKFILPDEDREPSPLLQTLARLPFKLVVTTNYDRLMERALVEAKRPHYVLSQPSEGFTPDRLKCLQERLSTARARDELVLYKIHGTFGEDFGSEHVTVTEEDYIEFLTAVGPEANGLPRLISSEMVDGTLLFLGYSLEDWDFRAIYKGLIEQLHRRKKLQSFAIQKAPPDLWVEFWQGKGIEIYDLDVYEFAEQLAEKMGEGESA